MDQNSTSCRSHSLQIAATCLEIEQTHRALLTAFMTQLVKDAIPAGWEPTVPNGRANGVGRDIAALLDDICPYKLDHVSNGGELRGFRCDAVLSHAFVMTKFLSLCKTTDQSCDNFLVRTW